MAAFQSILYQMILSVLRDAQIISANPTHTNTFKGLIETSSDIGLDEELEAIAAKLSETVDAINLLAQEVKKEGITLFDVPDVKAELKILIRDVRKNADLLETVRKKG